MLHKTQGVGFLLDDEWERVITDLYRILLMLTYTGIENVLT